MSPKQIELAEKREMKEAKKAMGIIYNTKRPEHLGDGIASGLGNALKGTGAGLAAWGAMTWAGAKTEGFKGGLKGFGIGAAVGIGMTGAGIVTGVGQIGKGLINTGDAVRHAGKGEEYDEETGKYFTYILNDEAKEFLEKSDEDFLAEYEQENGKYVGMKEMFKDHLPPDEKVKDTKLYEALGVEPDAT